MTKMNFSVTINPDVEEDGFIHMQVHLGKLIEQALSLSGFGELDSVTLDDSVALFINDGIDLDTSAWPSTLQLAAHVIQTLTTRDMEAENYSKVLNEVINKLLELPVAKLNILRMVDAE